MKLNPTKRKDGYMRFTISLKYHINRNDLVDAICRNWEIYGDKPKTFRSRTKILRNLKGLIRQQGEWIAFDKNRSNEHLIIFEQACSQVAKYFPEM